MMMSTWRGQLRRRGGRLGAAGHELGHPLRIQVPHREIDAVPEQVSGELRADVTQSDETDPHLRHGSSELTPVGHGHDIGAHPGSLLQAWWRAAWLRRQAAGGAPNSRRKARLKARVGLVADLLGDAGQRGVAAAQQVGGEEHAPLRQVLNGRTAHQLLEALGEHRARGPGGVRQLLERPGARRLPCSALSAAPTMRSFTAASQPVWPAPCSFM